MGVFSLAQQDGVRAKREEWAAAVQASDGSEKSEGEVTDTENCGNENTAREPEVKMEDVRVELEALPVHVAATATATTAMDVDYDTDCDSDAASVSRFDELEDRLRHVEGQVADVHKARDDPFKVSTISLA